MAPWFRWRGSSTYPTSPMQPTLQEQSDGTLFFKIGNKGDNKMPAIVRVTDQQRWDLVNFLRTLSDFSN